MIKKYGRFFALIILLLVVTEVTTYVNRKIDNELDVKDSGRTLEALRESANRSEATSKGLNPYQEFWVYEIEFLRTDYPTQNKNFYDVQNEQEWNDKLTGLKDEVNTTYMTNEEILERVKSIVPDQYLVDIFKPTPDEGYFRSVLMLMEDDYNRQQETESNTQGD